jgi:plastocyanin
MRSPALRLGAVVLFGSVAACSSAGGGGGPSSVAREVDFSVSPTATFTGAAIAPAIKVEVKDTDGTTVTSSSASVALALIGGAGTLGGTVTKNAAAGVATFSDLTVSAAGTYQLVATSGALAKDTTAPFAVTDPPDSAEVLVGNASGGIVFKSQQNSSQNPAITTIAIGGKVHWTWVSGTHSVVPNGTPTMPSSALASPPFSFENVFNVAGTYNYICGLHGTSMSGRVIVR